MTGRQTPRLRRAIRWLSASAALGVLLLVVLYATFPWCVQKLMPLVAQRIGAEHLSLVASRPDWDGLHIARIDLTHGTIHVQATDTRVTYSISELLRGRVREVNTAHVDVSFQSQSEAPTNEPTTVPKIPHLPFDILSVKTLVVRLPNTGFVGVGDATLSEGGLHFRMLGEQPDAASKLNVSATLTREGVFNVKVSERDNPADHFVELNGLLADSAMVVKGVIDLTGFPLALACEIAGLPQGTGRVTAHIATTLPWPLPDELAFETLHGEITDMSIDWVHQDQRLSLNQLRGQATFAAGKVDLNVGGNATFQTDDGVLRAVAPPGYAVRFADGVVAGRAGLSVLSAAHEQTIAATVREFSLSLEPALTANLEADIDVAMGANVAAAHVLGRLEFAPQQGSGPRTFDASLRWANNAAHEAVALSGRLAADALSIEGRFDLSDDALSAATALTGMPQGSGRISGRVSSELVLPYTASDAVFDLSELDVNWRSSDDALRATNVRGSARLNGPVVDARLTGAIDYQLGERLVRIQLPGNYAIRYDGTSLRAGQGMTVKSSQDDERIDARIRSLSLTPTAGSTVEVSADVDAELGSTRAQGVFKTRLNIGPGDVPNVRGSVDFEGAVDAADQTRDATLSSKLSLIGTDLRADGSLTTPGLGALAFDLAVDSEASAGTLNIAKTFEFFGPAASLFLPDWTAAYDVDGGKVDARITLAWETPERIGADVSLVLSDVAAHYDAYLFEGVSGALRLSAVDVTHFDAWQLHPTRVVIANTDVGLTLSDATLDLSWSGNQVLVSSGTASVLGGIISASAIAYEFDTGSAAFVVSLLGLDLADVLALEGDNITGTGRLDGTLPVLIADNQPSVKQGDVRARDPGGTIALVSSLAEGSGQAELSFALTALKDFRYSSLEASVDYASNGDLDLGVALRGRNPAVEKNRPIHYNLNIKENIPVLLKSLRLKDSLNEDIEGRFND